MHDNFTMPVDLLVNGAQKRVFPTGKFQSFNIAKLSTVEVMDWKFYIKPVKKK